MLDVQPESEQKSSTNTYLPSYSIEGQNVVADSFEMHIPENYSLTDNGNSLRAENGENHFNITIEEHNYTDDDYDKYLSETILSYRQRGVEVSEPETVTIENYDIQRVKLSFIPMQAYGYFIDQGDRAFLISVVSNEEKVLQDEADNFIKQLSISF
jgi:hypothetical protein